eukprot:scaffold176405_cov19-Tisochrysis_lutea.AAC.1
MRTSVRRSHGVKGFGCGESTWMWELWWGGANAAYERHALGGCAAPAAAGAALEVGAVAMVTVMQMIRKCDGQQLRGRGW